MARAIAATPTLTGKDADRFFQNLNIRKEEILKRIPYSLQNY